MKSTKTPRKKKQPAQTDAITAGELESEYPNPKPQKRTLKHDITRVIFLIGLFAIAMISLKSEFVRNNLFNPELIREKLQNDNTIRGQLVSYGGFVLITTVLIGFGLPRLFVSTVAGSIYGAFIGTALALTSSMLGSLITYMLGKSVLRGVAKRRLGKHFHLWDKRLRENAFWWVLIARLAPFINGQMMNLLFGALRCPIGPFIKASLIGLFPLTLIFALLGSGAAKGESDQILIGGIMLIIVNIIYFVQKRRRKKA